MDDFKLLSIMFFMLVISITFFNYHVEKKLKDHDKRLHDLDGKG